MSIRDNLDKENLHHAYLIEGGKEEASVEILEWLEEAGIETRGNPDFVRISLDSLKIEDAFNLREMASEKSFSGGKKIFLLSVNSITGDAQGILLKAFEDPAADTHFFMIVPDASALFPTLLSRFYVISGRENGSSSLGNAEKKEAEEFLAMRPAQRIDFLKEFLKEEDNEDEESADSSRARAGRFLNVLETVLHKKLSPETAPVFERIFSVRQYLRMPGSSVKNLMESVALAIPKQ